MYTVITGMSRSYYDNIGKYMLDTWVNFWPSNFTIKVYTEDDLSVIATDRIEVISLDTLDAEYHKFQNDNLDHLASKCKVYAKKAFPIIKHLQSNTGKLIWVDADVITLTPITEDYLNSLLTPGNFSCHLGVPQLDYYSVETGFFIIDLENKSKEEFLKRYSHVYYTRDFSNMKKPFDGDTFGRIISEMKTNPLFKYSELNPNFETKASPFNKVFKGLMRHYKARRKDERRDEFIK